MTSRDQALPYGSRSIMAQRVEPHDSLDHFPTPPWATRALCTHVISLTGRIVYEPACGDGAMVRPLSEYAHAVMASDVHDYGCGYPQHDFLQPYLPQPFELAEWIITNPPYRLGDQFVERALQIAKHGVAVLVRSTFTESITRYDKLYRWRPPALIAQFVERVPMVKGRLDRDASTATAYAWLVWRQSPISETKFVWIPPCRARLERASDYPVPVVLREPCDLQSATENL